jgi:2,4-dienoyl-CoA reductase-like NADH-dependent reductase (Old Yellow Enzyme family)
MPNLFSPITIKHVQFANRLAMPPMVRFVGEMSEEVSVTAGRVTPPVIEHYARRVRAGTGTIIVEATAVDATGRVWANGFNLYADEHIANLALLASGIRAAGGIACIQLVHGGPQGSADLCGGHLLAPSAIPANDKAPLPRKLTLAQIRTIQAHFADAAERAVAAGFHAVEIHGAHGYLLDSFLMRQRNHRTDSYGRSAAGRMRMLLETCQLVRQRIGDKALIFCRISPFTKRDEGYTLEDLAALVRGLEASGIDLLHVSTDGAYRGYFDTDKTLGHYCRELTRLPLMIAGGLRTPADAQRLIAENHADFAAVGTAMLRDPDFATHAREALQSG